MKISTLLPLLALAAALTFSACGRDKSDKEMSDDDIAASVESSLSAAEGGATLNMEQSARTSATFGVPAYCSLSGDSSINVTGSLGRYTLNSVWNWSVNCTGAVPTSISYALSGTSAYNGTNLDLDAILGGNFTLTGLTSGNNYILDGLLTRVGNGSLSTDKRTKEFSSEFFLDFDAVNISKSTSTIVSGSATVTLNGSVVDGNDYARTGSLVFNGDGTATLTLDNGAVFTITL
jgi:hypothetical protein